MFPASEVFVTMVTVVFDKPETPMLLNAGYIGIKAAPIFIVNDEAVSRCTFEQPA
jgi:hypothetical protein